MASWRCTLLQWENPIAQHCANCPNGISAWLIEVVGTPAIDDKYWKYLINGIVNAPTHPQGTSPSQTTARTHPLSPPSTPSNIKALLNSSPPRQRTRPSSIPSPRRAPTPPPISQTARYDMDGVWKIRRDSLGILLLTGRSTKIKIKTQYRILERIYHPEKWLRINRYDIKSVRGALQ